MWVEKYTAPPASSASLMEDWDRTLVESGYTSKGILVWLLLNKMTTPSMKGSRIAPVMMPCVTTSIPMLNIVKRNVWKCSDKSWLFFVFNKQIFSNKISTVCQASENTFRIVINYTVSKAGFQNATFMAIAMKMRVKHTVSRWGLLKFA